MGVTKEYLGQQEMVSFLAAKNGVSEAATIRWLRDVCDCILAGCYLADYQNTVYLPRLGTFKLDGAKTDPTIQFELAPTRKDVLKNTLAGIAIGDIFPGSFGEEQNTTVGFIQTMDLPTDQDLPGIPLEPLYEEEREVEEGEGKKRRNAPDVVRASMLKYLRESFPYGEHWEHPTNGCVYPHAVIKQRLTEYQHYNRGNYRALWA